MIGVKSIFDFKQIEMLKNIGVNLSDEKDYTLDELDNIYTQITDFYQVAAFDKNSEPLPFFCYWERIIDTFYDKTGV